MIFRKSKIHIKKSDPVMTGSDKCTVMSDHRRDQVPENAKIDQIQGNPAGISFSLESGCWR